MAARTTSALACAACSPPSVHAGGVGLCGGVTPRGGTCVGRRQHMPWQLAQAMAVPTRRARTAASHRGFSAAATRRT
eukprot:scaffold4116_cov106-Isochrysis_galbana.AAC.5